MHRAGKWFVQKATSNFYCLSAPIVDVIVGRVVTGDANRDLNCTE